MRPNLLLALYTLFLGFLVLCGALHPDPHARASALDEDRALVRAIQEQTRVLKEIERAIRGCK